MQARQDLSSYKSELSLCNRLKRITWNILWKLSCSWWPRSLGNNWRVFLCNLFGARVHKTAVIYPSVKIYQPWKLVMHKHSCLAEYVICYNVDLISIGQNSTVSQYSYLCSASHDITKTTLPLIYGPILLKDGVWVGSDCFIGMNSVLEEDVVLGARSSVFGKTLKSNGVYVGSPAKRIKSRFEI